MLRGWTWPVRQRSTGRCENWGEEEAVGERGGGGGGVDFFFGYIVSALELWEKCHVNKGIHFKKCHRDQLVLAKGHSLQYLTLRRQWREAFNTCWRRVTTQPLEPNISNSNGKKGLKAIRRFRLPRTIRTIDGGQREDRHRVSK